MTDLERALLDLGMEDLIALPETLHAVETVALLHRSGRADDVARALVSLLESDRIQVWGGRWQDEPEPIDHGAAAELLQDTSQYEFGSPADGERRLFYVNVDNLRAGPNGDVRTRGGRRPRSCPQPRRGAMSDDELNMQRAGEPEHGMATDPSMSRPEGAVRAAMALVPDLSPTDVGSVELMLDGGEWVPAFEVMCEQAFEYDVPVSRQALDTIRALGRELGAREYYADLLRANVHD